MRSYYAYYQILFSLTTVTVVSLATTSDDLNSNGGDVIQSLMNFPDSQSQWDDIALLGFDYSKGAIKGWGEDNADNNSNKNAWAEEPLVAEEYKYNYHGCSSRANNRRRGKNTDYCSPIDTPPLHFRPRPSSSQQEEEEDGQTQTGSSSSSSSSSKKPTKGSTVEPEPEPSQQQKNPNPQTDADGENLLAPPSSSTSASEGENNCPPRYRTPICATSKLERDPTQQGGWRREPWDESAASDVLFQQDFCRIWLPQARCEAESGIERFMCCRSVKPIVLDAPISIFDPVMQEYLLRYPKTGFMCILAIEPTIL